MQEIRERARANLPTVLLTLLSIVQALALEFLWTFTRDNPQVWEMTWISLLTWLQLAASFLGLVLIWVVYASHVMRLRWVPTTTDSIYPFAIGLLEFVLIELLGAEHFGGWMISYAAIFALMVWISHRTMRRARLDGQNEQFFNNLQPAEPKDFYGAIAGVIVMATFGAYVAATNNTGVVALIGILATALIALYQFRMAAYFWERSLSDDWPKR